MNSTYFIVIVLILSVVSCRKPISPPSNDDILSDPVVSDTEYRDGEYIWRPSRIKMTLHDGDHQGTKGQYLLFEQFLPKGESGWGSFILDLPDSWSINNLRIDGLAIRFENQNGEAFSLQPPALNDLDFDILDGGNKPDSDLEALWRKYALKK